MATVQIKRKEYRAKEKNFLLDSYPGLAENLSLGSSVSILENYLGDIQSIRKAKLFSLVYQNTRLFIISRIVSTEQFIENRYFFIFEQTARKIIMTRQEINPICFRQYPFKLLILSSDLIL